MKCGDGDVVALSTSSFNFLDPSHQLWALKLGFMVNTVHEIDSGDTLDKPCLCQPPASSCAQCAKTRSA